MKFLKDKVLVRKSLIALLAISVIAVILLYSRLSPAAVELRDVRERCRELKERTDLLIEIELPATQAEMLVAGQLSENWDDFSRRNEALLQQLPLRPESGMLLESLCELVRSSGIDLFMMTTEEVIVAGDYSILPVGLEVRCDFSDLEAFLTEIEGLDRLIRVERLKINHSDADPQAVDAFIEMVGYVRGQLQVNVDGGDEG